MKTNPRILSAFAVFAALLANHPVALAHGNDAHADHAQHVGSAKPEQKPWGIGADAKAAGRSITIGMSDAMRFTPDLIEIKQGETIKFVIKNEGRMLHEFVLGTRAALDEHAALMLKFPNMAHEQPYMAHVQPGKTAELVWTFNRAGEFDFACLIAGHFQAGMVGKLKVVAAANELSDGEIRKVDKSTKKLTIKHGDIKSLDMPGMTMLFQVKDVAMLERVKPGDKVKFQVERLGGALVVTELLVTP